MLEIYLDAREIKSKDDLHDRLEEGLELPEYYGRNLDSLWDLLSVETEGLAIYLASPDILIDNLDSYAEKFIELLLDLDEENPNLEFYIVE